MTTFLPPPFSRLLACAIFPALLLAPAAANEISYKLPKDGKVSLAVYNSEGQMVRTLRNTEPQKAGAQTVKWDGLDLNGKPAPAGNYTWKLLLSQGMKAEYLLNLGISSGIKHWVGQHGGPSDISVEGDSFTIGGTPEGSPLLVKSKLDGTYQYPVENFEPAGFRGLTTDGGITYVLMESGKLFALNSETGRKITKPEDGPTGQLLALEAQSLEPIAPTTETKSLKIPVGAGRYLLKVKAGQAGAPSGAFQLRGDLGYFDYPATAADKFTQSLTPPQYSTLLPKAAVNGQFNLTLVPPNATTPWAVAEMKLLTPAEFIDARFGELIASYPAVGTLAWLDPKTGQILEKIELPERKLGDAALVAPGKALAFSGTRLKLVSRDGSVESKVEGLVSPVALAIDPSNGGYWVVEGGKSQQVKFFDKDFQLKKTFGLLGGRLPGAYVPENFLAVSAIAADGKGGFLITEADSAPRRTAHFDANGKLLKEWYGGQQFYSFAAPDPEDADIVWMDSQWGWIMKIKVDWDKRDWKVLGTYRWGDDYSPELFNRFKMAHPHRVLKLDLDKDGQKETYLTDQSSLQRVDEASGGLRLVSMQSFVAANRGWEWNLPIEKMPQPWVETIRLLGEDPAQSRSQYRAFSWADANGDTEFQAGEFLLAKGRGVEASRGVFVTEDLSLIRANDWEGKGSAKSPNYNRYPTQGFTASGSPIWDWRKSEPFPAWAPGNSQAVFISKTGDIYQIIHGAGGDGYKALGIYTLSHSYSWPGTQTHSTGIWKWNAKGELQWIVGPQATKRNNDPGQMHFPVHFAGLVNGTIGVCDKIVQPVVFWTEDGLYAGGLLDRRAEDGLPPPVYSWWTAGTDDSDPQTGRAMLQFDMALGGSLIQRPNGDVIFIGSGWNSSPAYRVTGWENFERQEGKLTVKSPATTTATHQGTGLKANFFANSTREGTPAFSQVTPQIWFEPTRANEQKNPAFKWPVSPDAPALPSDQVSAASWTGSVEPTFSEDYTFHLYRQNGTAQLWLGGRLILEANSEATKVSSAPLPLKAGEKYNLRLEWTGKRAGELHLSWQSLSQPVEHIPTRALYPESSNPSAEVISLKPSVEQATRPIKGAKPIPPPEWILTRAGSLKGPLTVDLQWSGSARPGTDYSELPARLTFKAGQNELRVPIRLLPVGTEIAPTTSLSGAVQISSQYHFDGQRDGGSIQLSDPRIQRLSGVNATVVELQRPENPPVPPNFNSEHLVRLLDGSGLDTSTTPPTHDTNVNHTWRGEWLNFAKVQLNFDLGGLYQVTELRIWNFNTRDSHEKGWGHGDSVRWAAEGIRILTAVNLDGPWTDLGATSLRRPLGQSGDPGQLIRVNQTARYVRLTFPQGGVRPIGLAEIAFYGVPTQSPR